MLKRISGRAVVAGALAVIVSGCAPNASRGVDEPLEIVVISDLNSGYGSTQYDAEVFTAVSVIRKWRPDLVLIGGDMIAGQRPSLTDENVRAMWAAFDSVVAAPLRDAGIPFAFTLGNHDGSGHPAHDRDRRLAAEYWNDPVHSPQLEFVDRAHYPRYYSFVHNGVFFVSMDASTGSMHADTAQIRWLRGALASEKAKNASVRMVLGHVPLYAVAEGRNLRGEVQGEPELLRLLLEELGVRMYISGHHHAYYPARRGDLELLHAGAAGSGPRPLIGSNAAPYKTMTLLTLSSRGDAVAERTWRLEGAEIHPVDVATLPERIDGINGFVIRRATGR